MQAGVEQDSCEPVKLQLTFDERWQKTRLHEEDTQADASTGIRLLSAFSPAATEVSCYRHNAQRDLGPAVIQTPLAVPDRLAGKLLYRLDLLRAQSIDPT